MNKSKPITSQQTAMLRDYFLQTLISSNFWTTRNFRIKDDLTATNIRTGSHTPITIKYYSSGCQSGLSIGFHKNFSNVTGALLPKGLIPEQLDENNKTVWFYKCFDTKESIAEVIKTISGSL